MSEQQTDFSVDFDLDEVQDAAYDAIPAGKYRALVTGVELRDGYGGDGKTLWVKMTLLDGATKNRKLTAFLDVHSSTDWKQAQGRRLVKQLKNILEIENLTDFNQLVTTAPIGVEVRNYKRKSDGELKEDVKGFLLADDVPVVDDTEETGLQF